MKSNLITLFLIFILTLSCTPSAAQDQVSMESYTIQKCFECNTKPPRYEEITEIYQIDDQLTELSLMVTGNCFMKDSLDFKQTKDSLNFNYNFFDPTALRLTDESCWYSIKVLLYHFQIPNNYRIMADGLEIYVNDDIYFNFISSSEIIDGEEMNVKDYFGRKQGRWFIKDYYGVPISDLYYKEDIAIEGYRDAVYDYLGRLTSYIPVEAGKDLEIVNHYYSSFGPKFDFYSNEADE
ncbi:MAG: hypothetical protein AB8B53_15125 [Flavobacteriales bacterium]